MSSNDYKLLKKEYEKVCQEIDELKSELKELQQEYCENTIIQSMNDMRDRYQELLQTTVSKERYNSLLNQRAKYIDHMKTIHILLNNVSKHIGSSQYNVNMRIKLIMEIIDDIVQFS